MKIIRKILLATAIVAGLTALFLVLRMPNSFEVAGLIPAKETESPARPVKLIFAGDIMLARSVGIKINTAGDYLFPFRKAADYLRSADITFGNLESVISDKGYKVGSIYSFRAEPGTVAGLEYAGFDVVSVANNHAWDYTSAAFLDSIENLDKAGIAAVGGGMNFETSHEPWIEEIQGTKFAFLAYTGLVPENMSAGASTPGINLMNIEQMTTDVKTALKDSDIVIVSMHDGDEYQTKHNARQEEFAKAAIDAGAALVIGHHPHVVQEVENYNNGWIAYSLGNFVFDQFFSEETMRGLVLEVEVADGKISSVKQVKTQLSEDYQVGIIEQ